MAEILNKSFSKIYKFKKHIFYNCETQLLFFSVIRLYTNIWQYKAPDLYLYIIRFKTYMKLISVITGDIVDSRGMSINAREKLYLDLKKFLEELKKQKWIKEYELFRGDSFQCVIEKKEETLKVSLMIRGFIKSYITLEQKDIYARYLGKGKMASKGYFPGKQDIRLAIGIGKVDFMTKNSLAHSDGEAFYLSGDALDRLKSMPYRMMLKTPDIKFNESIEPTILLLDAVLQKWTNNQAETVLFKLKNMTEDEIAKKLKITQSAVNQRTKTSQWYAIEKLLVYFTNTLKDWK